MFHARHFLLAARPRASTARRLALFLLVVLSLAAGAPFAAAEMVYYTEDFCNDGEPGFDPMFNHELEWPAHRDPATCWGLHVTGGGAADDCRLRLSFGTYDTITFNLSEGQRVAYASVECPAHYFHPSATLITFLGETGIADTSQSVRGDTLFEASSTDIGYIHTIVLYSTQGAFSRVRIGVIPEPAVASILLGLTPLLLAMTGRRHRNG